MKSHRHCSLLKVYFNIVWQSSWSFLSYYLSQLANLPFKILNGCLLRLSHLIHFCLYYNIISSTLGFGQLYVLLGTLTLDLMSPFTFVFQSLFIYLFWLLDQRRRPNWGWCNCSVYSCSFLPIFCFGFGFNFHMVSVKFCRINISSKWYYAP